MNMRTKSKIHKGYYDSSSAEGVGWARLSNATMRSTNGATRRSYRSALAATSTSNTHHHLVSEAHARLTSFVHERDQEELALVFPKKVITWVTRITPLVELPFGMWCGWELGGGSDPLLSGMGYFGPVVTAVGLGGTLAASAWLLAEGAGGALAKFIARADATSLKPTATDLEPERIGKVVGKYRTLPHFALVMLAAGASLMYFAANRLRESLISTASIQVSPTSVAALACVLPFAAALVKAKHYSREAAAHASELQKAYEHALLKWKKLRARAEKKRGDAQARFVNVIASAELDGINQQTNAADGIKALLEARLLLPPLLDTDFPALEGKPLTLKRVV